MNLLSRFRQSSDPAPNAEEEAFVRRRSFTATQYRDDELARAAEERAAREAADQAAAEASAAARAQRLADAAAEQADGESEDGEATAAPQPMDWEEAVGFLSTKSAEARSFVAHVWNWEQDLRVLQFLMAQPDMDLGTATGVFWLTGATDDFFPWGDDVTPADEQFRRAMDMVDALGRRFAAGDFAEPRFGFDDSWDCSQLKERLEALYLEGRIDWTPANLLTVSPGPEPTIDDVPQEERQEIKDFLRRQGAL